MSEKEGYITTEDSVRLYFRSVGNGPAVVIPNGMYFFDDFKRFVDSRRLIFYDVRNRGFSDSVSEKSKLTAGIQQDVEDLEAVRRHFGLNRLDLIGHSYIGLMVALYAIKYNAHVNRMVQIGSAQPDAEKEYPAHLRGTDGVMAEVFSKIAEMRKEKRPDDPEEACKKFWSVLRLIYVFNPASANKINWGRCDLPNERNFMKYWNETIFPSIQNVHLTNEQLSKVKASALIIHGDKDRSAPYGGARDWAMILPNARLVTVKNVAHAPWIEAPEGFFNALRTFLDGNWPGGSEKVQSLDPSD
jgi:proline iminopeptidase